MFLEIFLFELKIWFKKPSTYIFFFVFFSIAMLLTAAIGGLLGTGGEENNIIINSALQIAGVLNGINTDIIGAIILISIIAPAVYKDFQYNTHALLFTKPITKFGYIGGRFVAAFIVALFVLCGSVFGHFITCLIPTIQAEKLGAFSLLNYIEPFFIFVLPNTLLVGAIFFSVVTFSRSMIAGYVGCVAMIILKSLATSLLGDLDNKSLAALIEPFGELALNNATEYWSPAEQNTLSLPLHGLLLYNRLIWLVVGIVIFAFSYFKFQFSQFNNPLQFFKRKHKKEANSVYNANEHSLAEIINTKRVFNFKNNLLQIWFLAKFEFFKITKSIFFLIIIGLSILSFVAVSSQLGLIYGTNTYPVTYQILQFGGAIFQFFMIILIVFFSGTLVWRERDAKIDELIGVTPIASWVSLISKLKALVLIQIVLLLVIMLTGVAIQGYNNYYKFELLQYIKELFGFKLIGLTLICAFSIALQVIINQRYVAYFVTVLLLILLPIVFGLLEWNNQLIQFNSSGPRLPYSDMNGYGHILFSFFFYKMYWLCFSIILLVLAHWLYNRGKERGFKSRLRLLKTSINVQSTTLFIISLIILIACGGFIYYNTSVLNKQLSSKEQEEQQVDYEKKYKRFTKTQQPRITSIYWDVAIYPEKRGATMKGYYWLKNKNKTKVDSIIFLLNSEISLNSLSSLQPISKVLSDSINGLYIYRLQKPLQLGDSIKIDFDISYFPKGFKALDAGTAIVSNGTFFNSMFLPAIGYNEQFELDGDIKRKKYGLGKKERMNNLNDSAAYANNYISNDADWINFECTVSTSSKQTAIAPGYLLKQWNDGGRNYFHYKMDCKILNFYSFLSAEYQVKKAKWNDVTIEIYYHLGHEYNINRMISSIQKSLAYFSKNFSPYQHKQVRIIEFPRYASFAQSFPNTIPFSEGIGFIAKVNDKDAESIDYPFYVTSHEVAHQWWAHQVIGANVQGSTLMAETMAQYSALMVMEKEYGKLAMKKFLKYEMDKYLQGRATEGKKELPLMKVENQQYIHYNKGSVIMYALKDYIGEDSLNAALARYIKKVAFQEPPYTNATEFVSYLKQATPDSLKYIIDDMFESITLYENKVSTCNFVKTKEGKYLVNITVDCKKMKADSLGKLKDVAVNDWIDIGVFGKDKNGKEVELYLQKRKITKEKMQFEIEVNQVPFSAGIDPYNKLIDRTPDNNLLKMNASSKPDNIGNEGASVSIEIKN